MYPAELLRRGTRDIQNVILARTGKIAVLYMHNCILLPRAELG